MRRALVAVFSVVALLGLLAAGATSLSAQDTAMANHPLVGAWELTADIGDGDTSCKSEVAFTVSGSYIDVDCDGAVVIGVWEPTGEHTANMTFTSTDSDGTYRVRAAVEVAADGQTFTAPFTFEVLDPTTGEGSGQYGPGMATGTRLVAEAPGTPIAPVSELFAQFEASPEATPAG